MNDFRDYEDYIQHYGIKGMHWGIRRYQNPDGSLTDAGAKRYTREINRDDAKYNQAKADAKLYKKKQEEASAKGKTEKAKKFAEKSKKSSDDAAKYLKDRNKGITDVNNSGYNLRSKEVNRIDAKYAPYRTIGAPFGAIGGGIAAAAYHANIGKYRDVTASIKGEKFTLNGRTNGEKGGVEIVVNTKNVEDKMKKIKKNLILMNQISQQQVIDEQRRASQRAFEEMNMINNMNWQNMLVQQQMHNQIYGF